MKALFVTNAFTDSKNVDYKATRMSEVFAKYGISSSVVKNSAILASIDESGNIAASTDCDFVVYFDKDKYIARLLEKSGIRVFNSAIANELCDDKMLTHITLANNGIPMPKTVAGAVCYWDSAVVPEQYVDRIEDKLGLPIVAKLCYGGYGEQVYKLNNRAELVSWIDANKTSACLFQEYIECFGRDIRVIVIGGKAVATMMRTAREGEFRSNIELGGVGSKIDTPQAAIDIAEKAADVLGLDYCGVDVLVSEEGYVLCEVNSNAMFGGIERVTGIDVAEAYCKYILVKMGVQL